MIGLNYFLGSYCKQLNDGLYYYSKKLRTNFKSLFYSFFEGSVNQSNPLDNFLDSKKSDDPEVFFVFNNQGDLLIAGDTRLISLRNNSLKIVNPESFIVGYPEYFPFSKDNNHNLPNVFSLIKISYEKIHDSLGFSDEKKSDEFFLKLIPPNLNSLVNDFYQVMPNCVNDLFDIDSLLPTAVSESVAQFINNDPVCIDYFIKSTGIIQSLDYLFYVNNFKVFIDDSLKISKVRDPFDQDSIEGFFNGFKDYLLKRINKRMRFFDNCLIKAEELWAEELLKRKQLMLYWLGDDFLTIDEEALTNNERVMYNSLTHLASVLNTSLKKFHNNAATYFGPPRTNDSNHFDFNLTLEQLKARIEQLAFH